MKQLILPLLLIGTVTMAAPPPTSSIPLKKAAAQLKTPSGKIIGTAELKDVQDGVTITIRAKDLPVGPHGIHIHAVGKCDPPDFKSAGPHFSKAHNQHGLQNRKGPHDGDLPNLIVGPDGSAFASFTNYRMTLTEGPHSILDDDGASIIIHQKADDQKTDPAGNSGDRIACGEIKLAD